ncbi:MAG: signal peptidase II [Pseudomonadota bacterium]
MTPTRLGALVAAFVLISDQITKYWALDVLEWGRAGRIFVTAWFDLVLVWNRGISYGLFQQESDFGRWALVAIAIAAAIGCSIWLKSADNRVLATGLGLIVGGAIGNGIDRAIHGAVIDFVSLHYAGYYWYVFNIADAAIVAAVAALVYDSFRPRRNVAENEE